MEFTEMGFDRVKITGKSARFGRADKSFDGYYDLGTEDYNRSPRQNIEKMDSAISVEKNLIVNL
jgi:hypothetical protein